MGFNTIMQVTIAASSILVVLVILFILMLLWVLVPSIPTPNHNGAKIFALYTNPFVTGASIKLHLPNQNKCTFEGNVKYSTLLLLLAAQGYYEKSITQYLLDELHKYDMFIDIGANEGYYSILAKKLRENHIHVLAFEPSPSNVQKLKEHIETNQLSGQIELHKCAVGDTKEILEFKEFALSGMLTSGTKEKLAPSEFLFTILPFLFSTFKTECIPLDSVASLSDTSKKKLFKIDVEGSEYSVLLGMKNILKNPNSSFIVEITPNDNGSKVFDLFFQEGYEAYDIDDNSKKITREYLPNYMVNVVFTKNDAQ